jgi:NitT/TauT family transport system substrate-binding protein
MIDRAVFLFDHASRDAAPAEIDREREPDRTSAYDEHRNIRFAHAEPFAHAREDASPAAPHSSAMSAISRRNLACVLGCLALLSFGAPARAQTWPVLRLATTPIDTGSQIYYAADAGFFKKAGFDTEITSLNAGSAIAAGVVAGSFDFAQVNLISLAQARERGVHFVLVAPAGLYVEKSLTSALVVAKAAPFANAKDMNGKTIAVNALSSIQQLGVAAWLDKNGGDSTTVKFVEAPIPQMVPSLVASRIDGALVAEPELDTVEHGTSARVLGPAYSGIAKVFLISAWVTSAQYAHDHPDVVRKFADVMAETARWANAHSADSGPILQKYTKVAVTPTMARVQFAETFNAGQIQPVLDAAAKYGLLKSATTSAALLAP